MKIWAVSLLTTELSPRSLTIPLTIHGIRSLIDLPSKSHNKPFSALPPWLIRNASPKAISGRTSYYQARLAFHFLPQLIPEYCTAHGFGPPPVFRRDSPWPWQARLASGLKYLLNYALLTLAFTKLSSRKDLNKEDTQTRWLVLQKARRHHRSSLPLVVYNTNIIRIIRAILV